MKLIYLNILKGCFEDDRLENIKDFVKKINPHFLILSEVYGWRGFNKNKFQEFKSGLGFKYMVVLGNEVAILSNIQFDFKILSRAALKINFDFNGPISLIATHLYYLDEKIRLDEIDVLLKNISLDERTILIGDLNSLSPLDKYDETKLLSQLKKRRLKKFGEKKLRRDVQKRILKFGMIDSLRCFSEDFEYSVPTKFNCDFSHFSKLRLDYAYISPNLLSSLKFSKILRTEETDMLSDHYPLILEFNL